ncbi:alpha/beta-hydrolase [Aspergillus eucalypticola CBS 122712]|uniref:Alpha/beta-hydrolase n=1 Tax=Aspergillus eucalypticola (strain CBS 122712 / IBT 29274) TaxID=1448314 RepID=A0A317UVW3_ASPEC|nr:alpha/beta-hydrolase [Aspergillus eucalypticola CBS 122712]PWY65549.1 alpha/beta-hydrolase [Aspergillus eucalypticola CBS 122712]
MFARGTTELYPGTPYTLAEVVAEKINLSSNYESIIYPAVSEDTSDGYFLGRAAVGRQVTAYAEACPGSQVVLLSYSQGAMIVGDAMAGGGSNATLGDPTPPLISEEVSKHITADVFYGNPRHVSTEPYDFGTCRGGWSAFGFDILRVALWVRMTDNHQGHRIKAPSGSSC